MLQNDHHIVRICKASLAPNGVPQAGAFSPHPGTDSRPADEGLSVHWLECLRLGAYEEQLAALREFLKNSPVEDEFKGSSNAVLAVIPTASLNGVTDPQTQASFRCVHAPRNHPKLPVESDPHSEIHTTPAILEWKKDDAWRLMVQQYICDQIVHSEFMKAAQ